MKGLALLVGTSLSLALPRLTAAAAWSTELWPMAIGAQGFSPDSPPTLTVRA